MELRPIRQEEYQAFAEAASAVFLSDPRPEEAEADWWVFELDRSIGVFDGGRPVGTAAAFSRDLTVPGGTLPAAAISWVSVAPTHRRMGLLTRMMRHQLDELHEQQREPVAALWASESAIYGRFGYGSAAYACSVQVATGDVRLRPDVSRDGQLRACSVDEARPALERVYEAVRVRRPGYLDRRGRWWDYRLWDPEFHRDGAGSQRYLLHEGANGPDGFVRYAVKAGWEQTGPAGEVRVRELVAASPAAYAALWGFLLELDLVRSLAAWNVAVDDPLPHLVVNPRGVVRTVRDGLWVRLVDVDRALAARRYARDLDVVLDVRDAFCPWNARRFRLEGGEDGARCTPTDAAADLSTTAAALGAAYLGGPTLAALAAAGLVTEERPGRLAAASAAFREDRAPHCPEIF